MSIASLVLGILSIPLCFLFLPAVLAVVFGAIALNQIKNDPGQSGKGRAIAGLVMGGLSLLFIVLVLIAGDASFEVDSSLLALV